mmetsp:Transcript_13528/g.18530  ORF Transcript_13528/g.18530 Transcript_13528/m.18530 type:complete len:91 (-) Transcript_13528:2583-2855(-)
MPLKKWIVLSLLRIHSNKHTKQLNIQCLLLKALIQSTSLLFVSGLMITVSAPAVVNSAISDGSALPVMPIMTPWYCNSPRSIATVAGPCI